MTEPAAAIAGQLDAFLLYGQGIPSVTVEVSRPRFGLADLLRATNVFWWVNPPDPAPWAANDVPATITALLELLDRTGGVPCVASHPELAQLPGTATVHSGAR